MYTPLSPYGLPPCSVYVPEPLPPVYIHEPLPPVYAPEPLPYPPVYAPEPLPYPPVYAPEPNPTEYGWPGKEDRVGRVSTHTDIREDEPPRT